MVGGPYPRVLNIKPMTMSRYLVFDVMREPDGDCYENVPECAIQAQRELDQAVVEYRTQDARDNLEKKQNEVEAKEIETLRETQAEVENLDVGDDDSIPKKSFDFGKPSFLEIKAHAIPPHEEMERHIVIQKQRNNTRKEKQIVTKTQRNETKKLVVTKTQRNETRKEENAEGKDYPGGEEDENSHIATKVDPKVEMERRKAVKKELEEMRKVDPPEERNDDIAEAIKDLHWSELRTKRSNLYRENRKAIEKFARQEQRKKYDEERIRQLGERTAAKIIIDQGLGNEKKSMAIKQNVANEIKKDMSLVKALKFRKERDICIQDYKRRIMQRREYYDIRKQKAARCHVSGYGRVNTASNYGYRIAGTGFFMLYTRSLYTEKKE